MADRRLIERQYSGSIEDLLHESRRALAELERVAPAPAPLPVPELLEVAGGWALMAGDTVQSVTPFADAWGCGR